MQNTYKKVWCYVKACSFLYQAFTIFQLLIYSCKPSGRQYPFLYAAQIYLNCEIISLIMLANKYQLLTMFQIQGFLYNSMYNFIESCRPEARIILSILLIWNLKLIGLLVQAQKATLRGKPDILTQMVTNVLFCCWQRRVLGLLSHRCSREDYPTWQKTTNTSTVEPG